MALLEVEDRCYAITLVMCMLKISKVQEERQGLHPVWILAQRAHPPGK